MAAEIDGLWIVAADPKPEERIVAAQVEFVKDEKGKGESLEAVADTDRLTVHTPNVTLVFAKAD